MSAIALTSAFGLASCSSTEDDVNINPTFDGQSVKTQFAINIPRAAGNNGTRATADQTQGEGKNFLGMEGIVLRPISGTTIGDKIGEIGNIISSADATTDGEKQSAVKIYSEVEVPVGTKNFLFYGFATAPDDTGNKFVTGSLKKSNNFETETSTDNINFQPETILTSTLSSADGQQSKIIAVLNNVMNIDAFKNATSGSNLAGLYTQFTGLKAGSANSVMQALQKLVNEVAHLNNPTFQSALKTAIETGDYYTVADDNTISIKSSSDSPFPRNLDLPDGIAKLKWENSAFAYDFTTSTLDGGMTINPQTVIYPAQLSYYANTTIKTSDSEPSSWPTTASAWNNASWNSWSDEVTSSTRAIALKDNINYGVASLKLTVKCANSLTDKDNVTVSIPNGGFNVTGLLVGSQPSKVDFAFQPVSSETFDLTAYDNFSTTLKANTTQSDPNYTILLPSPAITDANESVTFALELENGSQEFEAQDGIIPAGARFYLIGKLDPTTDTSFNPTGIKRIFMSDYQTTANVTISSLKNAYNVIPDIRNTKMQLGLSVDLTWKEGYRFDTTIGGDN